MKAVEYNSYGSPNVLTLVEKKIPEPRNNEILIKIKATTVSQVDSIFRNGNQFFARLATGIIKPKVKILGFEFSGIIEKIGKNVDNFKVGDKVFGASIDGVGTTAEYIVLPNNAPILKLSKNINYVNAAAVPSGALTALPFLKDAGNIKPKDKILIIGASGSIGTFAVQFAKYFDAEVTGVCSTRNVQLVKQLGADYVIDYTKENYDKFEKKYDIIFDTVGKSSFSKCKSLLTENGKYLTTFISLNILINMLITNSFSKNGKKAKIIFTGMRKNEEKLTDLKFISNLIENESLKPVIDKFYKVEDIREAHSYVDSGHKVGNVIILME